MNDPEARTFTRIVDLQNGRRVLTSSSIGRCNAIQCVDSTMLPRKNDLFGGTRSRPCQGSVPARLASASDFGFCFSMHGGVRAQSFVDPLRPPPLSVTTVYRQSNVGPLSQHLRRISWFAALFPARPFLFSDLRTHRVLSHWRRDCTLPRELDARTTHRQMPSNQDEGQGNF